MRQVRLVVGVIVLVAVLAFVNNGIHKNAPVDQDDDQSAASSESQNVAASKSAAPSRPLTDEEKFGNPATARYRITVGWVYDAANRAQPDALAKAIEAARTFALSNPNRVSLEIVDLDVPVEKRSKAARQVQSVGVRLNGAPVQYLANNPGEGTTQATYISHMLRDVTHK